MDKYTEDLNANIKDLENKLAESNLVLNDVRKSFSYKLGRFMTWPLRLLFPVGTKRGVLLGFSGQFLLYPCVGLKKINSIIFRLIKRYRKIVFKRSDDPLVSIIIPVYNQFDYTLNCLGSLLKNTSGFEYEVIIGDDNSKDDTLNIDKYVENIKVVRNPENLGFLRNCNNAVKYAKGRYLLFLNNDTLIKPGSVKKLLSTLEKDDSIGVVGGKLIFANNTLQEAGSIIWKDGSTLGYGRGDDPYKSEYSYVKEVYYCSGAFFMTPRKLFLDVGGFDELFAPAYYEEVDYCMTLLRRGYKIVYQPFAEIKHYEFVSHQSENAVRLQTRNREKFVNKWKNVLDSFYEYSDRNLLLGRVYGKRENVLIVDDTPPNPKRGSGFPRAYGLLKEIIAMGFNVTFFPLASYEPEEQALIELQEMGVEVVIRKGRLRNIEKNIQVERFEDFFEERKGMYKYIMISRPHNMSAIGDYVRQADSNAKIIYDAEAVYSVRELKFDELNGKENTKEYIEAKINKELDLAKNADCVTVVTEKEKKMFANKGYKNIFVISDVFDVKKNVPGFSKREGILFVGSVENSDLANPNYDSLRYFLREIYPKFRKEIKSNFYIVGTNKSNIRNYVEFDEVEVVGEVDDLSEFYNKVKLFIVPTRFAAGVPIKLLGASAFGLPSVATGLIAEQTEWKDGEELLVARDSEDFVGKMIALYNDEALWNKISLNASKRVENDCGLNYVRNQLGKIFSIV
jgi:GT2 family glycosyltransferase